MKLLRKIRNLPQIINWLLKNEWRTFCVATLGTVLMSFALVALIIPYRFAGAGLSGLALLTKYVFNISPAWLLAGGNVLILLWGWKELSPRFVLWTAWGVVLFSLLLKLFEYVPVPVIGDKFMAAMVSGVLRGLSHKGALHTSCY